MNVCLQYWEWSPSSFSLLKNRENTEEACYECDWCFPTYFSVSWKFCSTLPWFAFWMKSGTCAFSISYQPFLDFVLSASPHRSNEFFMSRRGIEAARWLNKTAFTHTSPFWDVPESNSGSPKGPSSSCNFTLHSNVATARRIFKLWSLRCLKERRLHWRQNSELSSSS